MIGTTGVCARILRTYDDRTSAFKDLPLLERKVVQSRQPVDSKQHVPTGFQNAHDLIHPEPLAAFCQVSEYGNRVNKIECSFSKIQRYAGPVHAELSEV